MRVTTHLAQTVISICGKRGGIGPIFEFFLLFWSFIVVAAIKAKMMWAGVLIVIAGAFYPGTPERGKTMPESLDVTGHGAKLKSLLVRFRGSLRALVVIGGIAIALYSLYLNKSDISDGATAYRRNHGNEPRVPNNPVELK
jgi:hypothetical protein